jgi:uncharacterized zinc-type alcohol dehydrogenase-like protein
MTGVLTVVGKNVKLVKVGDQVGGGCIVDSCLKCTDCKHGEEQMCDKQVTTYSVMDKYDRADTYPVGDHTLDGTHTPSHTHTLHVGTNYDMIEPHPALFATPPSLLTLSLTHLLCSVSYSPGYTTKMVVHERFVIIIPKEYPIQYTVPVMCTGVTLFDPFHHYKTTKGTRVSIVGLGGLGQMGVEITKTMGCVVTVVSPSVIK